MEDLLVINAEQAKRDAKLKGKTGASTAEVVNQLNELASATVFHDIMSAIDSVLEEKKINIYVYRRFYGKQIFFGIYAVPHGVQRTFRANKLDAVICKIEHYPSGVSYRKNGRQRRWLLFFLKELTAYKTSE